MTRKWLIPLMMCFMAFAAHGRQHTIDSLIKGLPEAKDTEKVQILLSLSRQYADKDASKSMAYGKEALTVAKKSGYTRGIASALDLLSRLYLRANDLQQALSLDMERLALYKKTGNLRGQTAALLDMGHVYEVLGSYPEALDYYFKALPLSENINDPVKEAITMEDIGRMHEKMQSDSDAIRYYLGSLNLLEQQKEKDYSNMAMIATSIGFFYKDRKQFLDKALDYFQKALHYAQNIPSQYKTHAITMTLTNLGSLYETKKDFHRALTYNQQAYNLAEKTGNQVLLGLNYQNRARIYKNMGEFNQAGNYYLKAEAIFSKAGMASKLAEVQNALSENFTKAKDFSKAALYAEKALKTAQESSLPEAAEQALKNLVTIHKNTRDYAHALDYQQQYETIKDTLLNREKANEILKLQIVYETNKKKEQIKMLQIKQEKEKTLRYVLFGGIILFMIIGGLLYHQQRMKNRKDRIIHTSQEHLMQAQLKNTQLHEKQLQKEIEGKNKELTTYALNFLQKNQLMEELKEKINTLRKDADGMVSQKLNGLQHTIRHSFNLDKNWDEFRLYFEQVHDRFFKALNTRFPDLSNKELRLCALLKLNLSSKEMATILGISPSSVKMARYRLRKKLNLDSEDDLAAFMINLEKEVSEKTA